MQTALKADACYIFSDVDGIYSADPNMITIAKRLKEISFDEMQEIADAGAKVLHNRCVQIGKKFDCNIIAKSTFSDEGGTTICQKIETTEVKSIVKNEKLIEILIETKDSKQSVDIYQELLKNNIIPEAFENKNTQIQFRIGVAEENKIFELLERKYSNLKVTQSNIVKLSIVGYGITQDNVILNKVITKLKKHKLI